MKFSLPSMVGQRRYTGLLFLVALVVTLIPIWRHTWYLTGDGPAHLYNAKVLGDWLFTDASDFYAQFYALNPYADPNWFSHVVLAGLLRFFSPMLTEKIFLSCYVLGFVFSLRWLLHSIHPTNRFLLFLGLPFVFVYPFQMGFYNYAISFVFMFICIAYGITRSSHFSWFHTVLLSFLNLLLYFTHPIGWTLASGTIVLLCIQALTQSSGAFLKVTRSGILRILASLIPGCLLFLFYLMRKGLHGSANPDTFLRLLKDFIELDSLMTLTTMETAWAQWIGILFGGVMIFGFIQKVRSRVFSCGDIFLLLFIASLCLYFFQPGGIAGGGIMSIRLQCIPYIFALFWLATLSYPAWMKITVACAAFVLGSVLIVVRMPHVVLASEAVNEIMSVSDDITDRSVVLPLSFCHNGKTTKGEWISNRIWLFMHAADYIGTVRQCILLGNYEANTVYFPILWKEHLNPFHFLGKNGGIESQPPGVDLFAYQEKTGVNIDYVLLWGLSSADREHPETQFLFSQLDDAYTLVKTSAYSRVLLYKRKSFNPKE